MRRVLLYLLTANLLAISALGCGSEAEKGKNRGKDMPKPADSASKEKGT